MSSKSMAVTRVRKSPFRLLLALPLYLYCAIVSPADYRVNLSENARNSHTMSVAHSRRYGAVNQVAVPRSINFFLISPKIMPDHRRDLKAARMKFLLSFVSLYGYINVNNVTHEVVIGT